jgi:hypothetical protein
MFKKFRLRGVKNITHTFYTDWRITSDEIPHGYNDLGKTSSWKMCSDRSGNFYVNLWQPVKFQSNQYPQYKKRKNGTLQIYE